MGFNRCPFQGPIKDTKRTKIRLDRNVASCTNVIGPLHECKKVCPCTKALPQSGIRAWIKQGWRKRKRRDRKDRGQEADGKKGSPTKQKHIWGTKQGLPRHRLRLTKKGGFRQLTPPCMIHTRVLLVTQRSQEPHTAAYRQHKEVRPWLGANLQCISWHTTESAL